MTLVLDYAFLVLGIVLATMSVLRVSLPHPQDARSMVQARTAWVLAFLALGLLTLGRLGLGGLL